MTASEAPSNGLAEGSRVCGDFTLVRLLRRAPLTSVWLARAANESEARYVARVVHVRRPDGAHRVERLLRALDALRELQHEAIPEITTASVEGEGPVIITPRIEGRTLRAIESRQPRPQLSVVSRVVSGVAAVLDALHTQQPRVVHRVVCPENVLVDVGGNVWLEECGLAHALVAAGWLPEAVAPNLSAYLTPDEIRHQVHPRTDIFALASVAWEWLAGKTPFPGDTEAERSIAILVGRRPTLTKHRPELPADLDELFARAWNADESRRLDDYPTAGAFAQEFERVLRGWVPSPSYEELPPPVEVSSAPTDEVDRAFQAMEAPMPQDTESESPTLRLRALSALSSPRPPPLPSAMQTIPGTVGVQAVTAPPPPLRPTPAEGIPVSMPAVVPTLTPSEVVEVPEGIAASQNMHERPTPLVELAAMVEPLPNGEDPVVGAASDEIEAEMRPSTPAPSEDSGRRSVPPHAALVHIPMPLERPRRTSQTPVSGSASLRPPSEPAPTNVPMQVAVASQLGKYLGAAIVLATLISAASQMYIARLSHETPPRTTTGTPSPDPTPPPRASTDSDPTPTQTPTAAHADSDAATTEHDAAVAQTPPMEPDASAAPTPVADATVAVAPSPAVVDAAVARATPDAAAPVVLLPLPRASDVQRIQSRLASAVARCIAGADVGSSVSLVVTYQGRNGHATWVHIPGPANAEPMASCLEAAVIQYTVPPFATPTWQTTYTFSR